jgi:serine/threonine protein kinase
MSRRIIDDQYEIIREIKAGGFGTIYYGWDLTLDRPVAIKEVVQSLLGEKQYVDMFIDEAMNTARLNHHNIVQVYSLRRTADNRVFIVMQYIEGVDLRDVIDASIKSGETISKNLMVFIISEVCKALEYAHTLKDRKSGQPLNIVHRDISPSNIMLTVEGSVKLIDFGIAKARHRVAQKTQTGFVKGKISYMSPEQLEGKDATRQSDIFSLGTVFYELCTGMQLFTGDSDFTIMKKIATGNIDFGDLDNLDVPRGFCDIVKKALTKDLSQRFASANDMYVDLYKLAHEHYPGEPTSELSRLVHDLHVKPPEEQVEPEVKEPQEEIKTKILTVTAPPEPVRKQKVEPKKEPLPKPEPPKAPTKVPTKSSDDSSDDEAKTVIFNTKQMEAKSAILDDNDDDGKTVVRDLPFAEKKSKKPSFNAAAYFAPFMKMDRRILIYGGGAIAVLILLFIFASLFGGGGDDGSTPSGDYRVWINSVPEGADVFLNDQNYGLTPLQVIDIADGDYTLRISLANADIIDTQFTLEENDQLTFPNFIMSRILYVNSIPQGASIFIDNHDINQTTPALVKISIADSVDIKLEHTNETMPVVLTSFSIVKGTFDAVDNSYWDFSKAVNNNQYELIGRFVKEVTISSKPQGADIYIANATEPANQTPSNVMLPYGSTTLRLVKSGFKDKVRTVNINEEFAGSLFYEMFREVSVTAVASDNPNGPDLAATIYQVESEGKKSPSTDKTPINLLLTGIEHKIYLKKDGYYDSTFIVGVSQTELKAVLRRKTSEIPKEPVVVEKKSNEGSLIFIFKDKKSSAPISGVDVIAERKSDKERIHLGSSNASGRLTVNIEEGKYKFISNKDGYKDWDKGKTVKKGKEYKFTNKLKRK